ncbi:MULTISPECIES: bifunctional riboflavin kinase/FAD synthetase [unclassified Sphingomonas]|uniref:bifunctional riboflavin kinase/FAD synthetase n=1 Tax=unclassified Sphingomonas TaxID=196159 RepID=UPI00092720E0|nr:MULTISPECIES: bifunctional riboflavin kinase/FAD synthetase [unclassified Sphingomonas]MBN8849770.1 bifunctional riboflavin kinase/FAD synthetase [Sphingomonas sp.]OJV31662.1 MAG: riboflavin biosynthesis protein RibF [Sphingomonas sp. 67-36]
MERLDGGSAIPPHLAGGIVALGNFDGFHLGHQAVIGRAVDQARAEGRPALVATFDPHPVRHFQPDAPPFRLTTLDQRERLFAAAGADGMIVFHFDGALAALEAEEFVRDRLVGLLGVGGVVTGEDFTFGHNKSGNAVTMAAFGARYGFTDATVGAVLLDGAPVSSSRIRDALREGNPREAARLLTRPWAIEGIVQHGDKLGREIGFPTANIDMGNYLRPAYGIYAVRGRLPDGRVVDGAANLGIRPSFDPPKELLEPHFFDFRGDLYGQRIEVELIDYLRPEAKFDTLEALVAQMEADCDRARTILAA